MHAERAPAVSVPCSIAGKVVLVVGGCDAENEVLVRGLTGARATVVWPKIHTPTISTTDKRGIDELRQYCLEHFDGVDAVVANFGGHDAGARLVETSAQECEGVIGHRILGHVLLSRAFAPVLARRPGSAYIIVSDNNAAAPSRGALRAAASAAELSLSHSLAYELAGSVNVHSLLVSSSGVPSPQTLDPDSLAEAVALILKHPSHAQGQVVISGQWREILDPTARGPEYCSCL